MKKNLALAIVLGLMLSACASRIDTDVKSKYETKSQIPLNVTAVLVQYDFNPTVKSDQSDYLFSRILVQGVEKWINARLRPAGQYGVAQIVVRDASVVGVASNYQDPEKLEGRLDVIISLVDARGVVLAQGEAKVKQDITAPKNISETERKELTQVLSIKLTDALDVQMEDVILRMSSSLPLAPAYPK